MITTFILDGSKLKEPKFNPEKNPKTKLTWIDITKPTIEELKHIKKAYKIHPLAIEDCLSNDNSSRMQEYTGHFFLALAEVIDTNNTRCSSVNYLIGKHIIITTHHTKVKIFEELKENKDSLKNFMKEGQDFFLHALINKQNQGFFPATEILAAQLNKIEDEVLKEPDKEIISKIFSLKKRITRLKRITASQKEIVFNVAKESPFISQKALPYYKDLYEHISKVDRELADLRENILGVLEVHLTMNANKTNDIMKVLTVIATIMLPLTLVASIYGMNFKFMPEIGWKYGYAFSLGIMAVLAGIMILYFRQKKWL